MKTITNKQFKRSAEQFSANNAVVETNELIIYRTQASPPLELPLFESKVSAGFPSPAEDYEEQKLDLNKRLIKHPSATFFVTVQGNSMINAGISDGDLLIVDRSLTPKNNSVVVCVVDNEFTVKRISKSKDGLFLLPANPAYSPIQITEDQQFQVWGVVSYVIKNASKV